MSCIEANVLLQGLIPAVTNIRNFGFGDDRYQGLFLAPSATSGSELLAFVMMVYEDV